MKTINIAKDYTLYPGGRYPVDGPYSGEDFRTKFLQPYLASGEDIIIELDGTRGYGSSFLEEAFGGLVRCGFTAENILKKIKLITNRTSLVEEVEEYIKAAQQTG